MNRGLYLAVTLVGVTGQVWDPKVSCAYAFLQTGINVVRILLVLIVVPYLMNGILQLTHFFFFSFSELFNTDMSVPMLQSIVQTGELHIHSSILVKSLKPLYMQ